MSLSTGSRSTGRGADRRWTLRGDHGIGLTGEGIQNRFSIFKKLATLSVLAAHAKADRGLGHCCLAATIYPIADTQDNQGPVLVQALATLMI